MRKERRRRVVQPHNFVVMVVSLSLGAVAVFGLTGILVLTFYERPIDAAVATMVGGAIGSLATLLTNVREHQEPSDDRAGEPGQPPLQTEVVNKPSEPVPTTEAPAEGDV